MYSPFLAERSELAIVERSRRVSLVWALRLLPRLSLVIPLSDGNLFLHPRQARLGRFGFAAFGQDVVGANDEMITVHQLHFCAPAPVGSTVGVGVTAEDKETVLGGVARAEHDRRVIVKESTQLAS